MLVGPDPDFDRNNLLRMQRLAAAGATGKVRGVDFNGRVHDARPAASPAPPDEEIS